MEAEGLSIGWDVGGWNCDRNRLSRDALVVIDPHVRVLGKPWRGNLRELINRAQTTHAFVQGVLDLCEVPITLRGESRVRLGIDTPLGFSDAFMDLLLNDRAAPDIQASASNPYLFRFTERFLFEQGLSPLSAVKDMIGSQATKGMHVMARFFPHRVQCGVWSDGGGASAVEVYPSSAKASTAVNELRARCLAASGLGDPAWHEDERDALTAALLAWLLTFRPALMAWPPAQVAQREGWIFVPKDCLRG
ncbi:hypothetical protein IAE35_16915 [Pseudomonas sp. S75]|uniref:hypothetical protein n=1 Tax=unclassified Pseudomonas TaxID=196821 RepID=UPI001905F89B|nr:MULTISPECIES: hypothetical protein [unclassified Pseudomonas]MBJ9977652.1 hypothetical protein [Pseudomonas sp. S30]MBK0155024.1 hypothetical protein [Pseudomonas sp. S75]